LVATISLMRALGFAARSSGGMDTEIHIIWL
jgi:hypothetical protein